MAVRPAAGTGRGWADDWTSALQRGHAQGDYNGKLGAVGVRCPCDDPLPPPMHYCSAAEQSEWESVLGRHEDGGAGGGGFATGGGGSGSGTGPVTRANPLTVTPAAPSAPVPSAAAEGMAAATLGSSPATQQLSSGNPIPHYSTSNAGSNGISNSNSLSANGHQVSAGRALAGAFFSSAPRDAPRPPLQLHLALELGSHCTRAVLHDGLTELVRVLRGTWAAAGPPGRRTSTVLLTWIGRILFTLYRQGRACHAVNFFRFCTTVYLEKLVGSYL